MSEILIVDDERILRETLERKLRSEGFEVRTARDGVRALAKIAEKSPDLVLLDVDMPGLNGFRVCEEIRKTDKLMPIVFLTAMDSEGDQLRALGLGGDDFVSKDTSESILLMRVNRALERRREIEQVQPNGRRVTMRIGPVTVNLQTLVVSDAKGEIARLTKTEVDILKAFDANRGILISKERLITELRGQGFVCEDAMIYTHVSNLRRKLGPAAGRICTIHRVGYILKR